MVRVAALTVIASLIAFSLTAQNLLVNPGFNDADQLTGWTCNTTNGVSTWSSEDRAGSATSGSVQQDSTASSDNRYVSCSQCVLVNELDTYIASTWVYWPDDPDVTQNGSPRIEIDYHANATCDSFLQLGDVQVGYPLYDTWVFLSTNPATAPAGTHSAMVFLFSWQNHAGEFVRARFDDIDFYSTTIFHDGFESGDTNLWVP